MTPERLTRATAAELADLGDLCLRSKAYWGYDAAFLDACRAELTLTQGDLAGDVAVIREGARFAGIVKLDRNGDGAEIGLLFVDPADIGKGYGRALFDWAVARARRAGAVTLRIEADPGARPFYERMGATVTGTVPSVSIPGRSLPLMHLRL